jgi:hypothetical protein
MQVVGLRFQPTYRDQFRRIMPPWRTRPIPQPTVRCQTSFCQARRYFVFAGKAMLGIRSNGFASCFITKACSVSRNRRCMVETDVVPFRNITKCRVPDGFHGLWRRPFPPHLPRWISAVENKRATGCQMCSNCATQLVLILVRQQSLKRVP